MKIRYDAAGPYGTCEGTTVRPYVSTDEVQKAFLAYNGQTYDRHGHIIRTDGFTSFRKGTQVNASHITGTTLVRLTKDGVKELWFMHHNEMIQTR